MTGATVDLAGCLAGYARRFHAALPPGHQVASPLGAWLLLALAAPAAHGRAREELTEVLGADVDAAGRTAAELLADPHPLVAAAAAAWHRPAVRTAALGDWLAGLPSGVDGGDIPAQSALDDWARQHTLGLIDRFPLEGAASMVVLLATALATRVSWPVPFDLARPAELGQGSPWTARLTWALRSPEAAHYRQLIAIGATAGDLAVHVARAKGGLLVVTGIAAPEVPAADVLADTQAVAVAVAAGAQVPRRSLFDLPLGDHPMWSITERPAETTSASGREERYSTVLPAWSATSKHDLNRPDTGFPAAAAALIDLLPPPREFYLWTAAQSATARYDRTGFEAAAVTALPAGVSLPLTRPGVVREATLRFGHPFAAVAVTVDERRQGDPGRRGPWHGVPVFSAWVSEPDDVDPPA